MVDRWPYQRAASCSFVLLVSERERSQSNGADSNLENYNIYTCELLTNKMSLILSTSVLTG